MERFYEKDGLLPMQKTYGLVIGQSTHSYSMI